MSTPRTPEPDPRFREGDTFDGLIRDGAGRWFTHWGLWALSDHHVAHLALDAAPRRLLDGEAS